MGLTQGTIVEPKLCSLCLSRHGRRQQSVYTCNHCSQAFCFDCMNDHTNELPHNVAQLSQQYHSLEQLFQTKYDMVQQEVLKSTEEIKQCFKSYQNDLLAAHQTIISGIENAKQNAEGYLNRIYSELQTINVDIELTLAREAIFQSERMESILI
ncbi:unnamed protein product [Rotaria sordida]|uniref:B box-type domain-containing protein n=1 Tax=Rotaria sordida TaxID=392033 RepID=A0A815Q2U0_9BILA|nr:unnamed protein product [Rotaria sordida]CAF1641126.1 unnamed protein product [Rotaria sordida]